MSLPLVPVLDRVDRAPAPGPWRADAACAHPGLDPDIRETFTTETPTWSDRDALAVCTGCSVIGDCAAYARRVRGLVGIWGGRRRGPGPPPPRYERVPLTGSRASTVAVVATVEHPKFSPVQVTGLVGNPGWTPEQAVALLEAGYTADRVADRTGYDLRWVLAQQRRLTGP